MSGGKQRLYLMCFHKHHQLHMGFRWVFGLDRVGKGALDGPIRVELALMERVWKINVKFRMEIDYLIHISIANSFRL